MRFNLNNAFVISILVSNAPEYNVPYVPHRELLLKAHLQGKGKMLPCTERVTCTFVCRGPGRAAFLDPLLPDGEQSFDFLRSNAGLWAPLWT